MFPRLPKKYCFDQTVRSPMFRVIVVVKWRQ